MNSHEKIFLLLFLTTLVLASGLALTSQNWWPPSTFQPQSLPKGKIPPLPPSEKRLTFDPSVETWPVWSPDNWHLAYVSDLYGSWSIWTMCEDGSKKQQLTSNDTVDMYPAWSPDGKKIAFASNTSGNFDIWMISTEAEGKTPEY